MKAQHAKATAQTLPHLMRLLEQETEDDLELASSITPSTRLVTDLDFDLVRRARLTRRLRGYVGPSAGDVLARGCTRRGSVVAVELAVLAEALRQPLAIERGRDRSGGGDDIAVLGTVCTTDLRSAVGI